MGNISTGNIGFVEVRRLNAASPHTENPTEIIEVGSVALGDTVSVVEVIASAFSCDPTWSWAFPDFTARKRFFELFINGALRHRWVFKTAHFESVSVWIPPEETEFSQDQEASIPGLLTELVGPRAADVAELLRRFGEAHPHKEPHYYLSLLGNHAEHRGRGLGMELLKENLARIDAHQMPAYLESSNPANNHRYESVGFKPISSFQTPGNGPFVTGMWREKN
jgi:GNAT superfamily N-acetyltransferase